MDSSKVALLLKNKGWYESGVGLLLGQPLLFHSDGVY